VAWNSNSIPWDIYVDDRKVTDDFALGFLEIPNTASFLQKLHRSRQRPVNHTGSTFVSREIHWNRPHLDSTQVAMNWIDCVFQHRCARFFRVPWPPGETKEYIVLRHLSRFARRKRLRSPFNVVVFLDFDSDHAKARLQNTIRISGQVSRCYHLDSLNNDCLQCADLLLGATSYLHDDPSVRGDYVSLLDRFKKSEKLKGAATKRLIAGHLASKIDVDGTKVYDVGR
jgi:Protein of unknown function (DUF3800)